MSKLLRKIEENLAIIVYIILIILTFSNVIGRYLLKSSISFTEEIAVNLFVLLSMIGVSIAVSDRAHLGLSALTELFPKRLQLLISCISNILGLIFGVVLLITGIIMVKNQIAINARTITLMWPAWIYGSFLPFGSLFIIYRFFECAIMDFKNYKSLKGERYES